MDLPKLPHLHNPRIVLLDLDLGRFGDGAALIAPLSRAGAKAGFVAGRIADIATPPAPETRQRKPAPAAGG